MNKKTFLAALLAVCLMLGLCACGGSEPAEQTQPSGDVATDPSQTPTEPTEAPAPTAPTPAEGEVLYTVKVVDTDGNPKAGAYVQMCLEACVYKVTDAAGNAYFCMAEADYKVTLMDDGTAPEGYTAKEHHFEDGAYEMTLVYDYTAENAAAGASADVGTEPSTNDVELDWG